MLKSIRNSIILMSLLYIIVGVVLLIFPTIALGIASMIIGAVTLIYGLIRLISYAKTKLSQFDLFIGILLAAAGIFLLICPQFLVRLIPIALGAYILVDSISAIKRALDLKALGFGNWVAVLLASIVLAALGATMIIWPLAAASVPGIFIGITFLFDGVLSLVGTMLSDKAQM